MYGSRKPGSIPTYPEASIQSIVAPPGGWWVKDPEYSRNRGRLVIAFLPHVSQVPIRLNVKGRKEPTENVFFLCRFEQLDIKKPTPKGTLPGCGSSGIPW